MTLHSTILAAENTIETGNPILNIAICNQARSN